MIIEVLRISNNKLLKIVLSIPWSQFSENCLVSRASWRNFCYNYLIISKTCYSVQIRAPAAKINQKNGQYLWSESIMPPNKTRTDNCREWSKFIKLNYISYFGWKCVTSYRYGIYPINFVSKQKKIWWTRIFTFYHFHQTGGDMSRKDWMHPIILGV